MNTTVSRMRTAGLVVMTTAAIFAAGCGAEDSGERETEDVATNRDAVTASTWTKCADEGGTCTFSGTRTVRYGTESKNTTLVKTGSTACSNAVFGDPAYGERKSCWFDDGAVAPTVTWTACANEGGTCAFSGTRTVRYGTESKNTTLTRSNGTPCTNAVFGDPAYGEAKRCWFSSTTSQPDPARPTYARTQIFPLAERSLTVAQGQDVVLRTRYYGVPLPDETKGSIHLMRTDSPTMVATAENHFHKFNSNVWSGYVEFSYKVNVPITVPVGTYRIALNLYHAKPPYEPYFDRIDGNGVTKIDNGRDTSHYWVGDLRVTPATGPASTAVTNGGTMVTLTPTPW